MVNDIDIIREYSNDERQGLTITPTCIFMPVRVTGLGKTLRVDEDKTAANLRQELQVDDSVELEQLKEMAEEKGLNISDYVEVYELDRQERYFCSPEALEAMQGMPILKDHPKIDGAKKLLDYKTFKKNPIIGTIVKTYMKNSSVWGLAKIYDLTLLDELDKFQSTSPAVASVNVETKKGDLIELPGVFNHLAFVTEGHWDQKGDDGYDASDVHFELKDKEESMNEIAGSEKVEDTAVNDSAEAAEETKTDEVETEVDECKADESVEERVTELENHEANEAKDFEKLAEQHENIKKDEGDEMVSEKLQDSEELEALKDEVSEEVEEVKEDETEEEIDEDDEEIVDEDDEEIDEDEEVVDEEENEFDDERDHILATFRQSIDRADDALRLKMPYVDKRLSPSATIQKILSKNAKLLDSKYKMLALDSANSKGFRNYSLMCDAFNNLLDNIEAKTNELRLKAGKNKKSYWARTDNKNVSIDRNF